jgi:hypothetical protein
VRICRRCETGAGLHGPHDKRSTTSCGTCLNSGSSSLKFGLYRVDSSIPKALISGEAESIGDCQGVLGQRRERHAVGLRIGEFRKPAGCGRTYRDISRRLQRSSTNRSRASCRAWRTKSSPPLPGRRRGAAPARSCNRLGAPAQSSGIVGHSLRAATLPAAAASDLLRLRHSTPACQMSHAPCQSPQHCDRMASTAMDFTAFLASRSYVNFGTIRRIG